MSNLLQRYAPLIQYDSHEQWFASPITVLTQAAELRRADGSVITRNPAPTFLRPGAYPNGEKALATDYLRQTTSPEAFACKKSLPTIYGRQVGLWLQYWLVYFYDDPGLLGLGVHQGDVEVIQLLVNADGNCTGFAYGQHRSGVRGTTNQIEWAKGNVPVTYPARGSHANLPHAGTHVSGRSFLPDRNDGRGVRVRPTLVVLDGSTPWVLWPGAWGGTKPSDQDLGKLGVEANSPGSFPSHLAWRNPQKFNDGCDAV